MDSSGQKGPIDDAVEDAEESGYGVQLEASQPLGDRWFLRGSGEWMTYGDDADFNRWETSLYGKYYNFGDGSGPGFGARVSYALNDAWTLLGSWDGIWVEDAGYNIDIDTQRFTLGAAWLY